MVVQVEGYPFPLPILNGPSWVQWNSWMAHKRMEGQLLASFSLWDEHRGEARLTTAAGTAELPNVIALPVLISQWHLLAQCNQSSLLYPCHKLHLAISPSILQQFSQSQWHPKALKKTFQSIPVMSQGNQYWPSYQADQQVTTIVSFIKLPISQKLL